MCELRKPRRTRKKKQSSTGGAENARAREEQQKETKDLSRRGAKMGGVGKKAASTEIMQGEGRYHSSNNPIWISREEHDDGQRRPGTRQTAIARQQNKRKAIFEVVCKAGSKAKEPKTQGKRGIFNVNSTGPSARKKIPITKRTPRTRRGTVEALTTQLRPLKGPKMVRLVQDPKFTTFKTKEVAVFSAAWAHPKLFELGKRSNYFPIGEKKKTGVTSVYLQL